MARKKQEIALQVEIETQEEWEEMLSKEGLTVVDIYQEWCGPCKAMAGIFRRIKNELGDDLLHFAVAKADTVDALEKYRGKCKPCFLFFAGGVLVSVIRGANSPLVTKTVTEQLNQEHKVLDGNSERKEVRDMELGDDDREKGAEDEDETEEDLAEEVERAMHGDVDSFEITERPEGMRHQGEVIMYDSLPETAGAGSTKKSVTVAIIKPDVVAAGKVDEIIAEMKERGIEILEQQEKHLTEDEAREFYAHKQDEEFYEDLVKFMSSGPSHILVLTKGDTGEGIVEEWRNLLGPASVEEAKEQAPDSLRAKYGGTENYVNAVHGSDSTDTAMKELAFFFPEFHVPSAPGTRQVSAKPRVQRTLALIRPDALRDHKDEILQKIEEAGFTVAMQKVMQLTKEQAERFYEEHRGQEYFEDLTNRMSSGPLLALALAREDAVTGWREKLGPKEVDKAKEEAPDSLRAQFAIDDVNINQFHGSDSVEAAQKELDYFFPMQQTVAAIKPDAFQTKDEIMSKIREAGFHIAARKETELTKDIAEQFYREHQDKEYFGDLTEHMASGKTLFMVLTREDAIDGWRSLIGPTNPEEAPDSLRAQYGHDIKANALHGSSTAEHAQESMKLLFGEELEFNPDGTVKGAEPSEEPEQEAQEPEQGYQQQQEEDLNKSEEEKAENESLEKGEEGETTEEQKEEGEKEEKKEGEEESQEKQKEAEKEGEQKEDGEKETEAEGEKKEEAEGEQKPEEGDGEKESEAQQTTEDDGQKEEGEKVEGGTTEEKEKTEEESKEDEQKEAEPEGGEKQQDDEQKETEAEGEQKPEEEVQKEEQTNEEQTEALPAADEQKEQEEEKPEGCRPTTRAEGGEDKPATPTDENKPSTPPAEDKPATPTDENKPATPATGEGEDKPTTPTEGEESKKE